jgi:ABC-2 type transport system ATP-binding protein
VETGSLADLRHLTRTSIKAELAGPADGIGQLRGVHDLRVHNSHVTFDVDAAGLGAALKALTDAGVRSLVSQPPTLEELFLRHYSAGTPASSTVDGTVDGNGSRERVSQ